MTALAIISTLLISFLGAFLEPVSVSTTWAVVVMGGFIMHALARMETKIDHLEQKMDELESKKEPEDK